MVATVLKVPMYNNIIFPADNYYKCIVPSTEKTTIISPPGLGVTVKVPNDAIDLPPEKCPNISIGTCSSESFVFPEGYVPLTITYQLFSAAPLKKKVELSIEHNAVIETEVDAKHMTFCIAQPSSDGSKEIKFTPLAGGEFEVQGTHCNLSTRITGLLSAGSMKKPSNII